MVPDCYCSIESHHRLALIIPTRNRMELLIKLLQSIQNQNIRPAQIIIVDGSDHPIQDKIEGYLSSSDTYIHVTPPSLTRQRNAGVRQIRPDITIAGFLDDDIEFETGSIEAMLDFWKATDEKTGGAEFNIINIPLKKPWIEAIRRFFYITGPVPGKVLGSGFCTSAFPADRDHPCEWLCGGATVWKREILVECSFDEWYSGWAYHEDAEFSYRVVKKFNLSVVHNARLTHNPPPFNPSKNVALGKMAVINRYHFVEKNPDLSIPLFYWSTLGEILINVMSSVRELNANGMRRAWGNILAVFHILRGDLIQVDENFRK